MGRLVGGVVGAVAAVIIFGIVFSILWKKKGTLKMMREQRDASKLKETATDSYAKPELGADGRVKGELEAIAMHPEADGQIRVEMQGDHWSRELMGITVGAEIGCEREIAELEDPSNQWHMDRE